MKRCKKRIMYANAQGLNTKKLSLENNIQCLDPDLIVVNELGTIDNINIEGYECIQRNRDKKKGGGVIVAIKRKYKENQCEVERGECDEYIHGGE